MLRRQFLTCACGTAALALLPACQGRDALTIGTLPWPGYEPLYLAEHFGWLPTTVRLRKAHSASQSIAGLVSGELDGATLTLDEALSARATGLPLSVVLVLNESVGADVVLARPDIREPADLRGHRIAVERSAVGGIVLRKLLAAGGLQQSDVTLVDLPHDQQPAAWNEGLVDAVITYAPTDSQIERAGGQRIFDSRQFPGTIFDILAVRDDRSRWRKRHVRDLIAAHLRGLDHLRTSRDDALRRIAAWRGLSLDEARRAFSGLALPDLTQNRSMLAPGGTLEQAAANLVRVMGLQDPRLDTLIDAGFLPELAGPA